MVDANVKSILLIRATGNDEDAAALERQGFTVAVDSFLRITASEDAGDAENLLTHLATAQAPLWLIATSVNAIEKWAEIIGPAALRQAIEGRKDLRFAAIGARTASVLKNFGASQVVTPETGDSESLAEVLTQLTTSTAILPSGSLSMKALPEKLRGAGWNIISGVVYETKTVSETPLSAAALEAGSFAAVVVRSPSAARALAELTKVANLATPIFAAGKTTARVVVELGLNLAAISPNPTPESVAETVKKWFQQKGIASNA